MQRRSSRRTSGPGRPPGSANSDGRDRLLDTAIDLFAERGIANTTVAQIAAAGNVTPGMVHYWFDTREKLLDAVVEERMVPQIRRIWEPADTERDSAMELVRGLLARWLEVTAKAPWLPSLWLREIIQEGGMLRERVLDRIPRERNAAFRRNITRAQERGEINPDISPELLFISIIALVLLPQAVAKHWRRVNPEDMVERAVLERHVMTLMLHGLSGPAMRGQVDGLLEGVAVKDIEAAHRVVMALRQRVTRDDGSAD